MTITSSGKPSQNARVWSCEAPTIEVDTQHLSISETGATFSDPDGKGSGSSSWTGMKRSFYEGEKVTISLNCTNMILSFSANFCADGKPSLSRGVRHPWETNRSSQTFDFVFQPVPGRKIVGFTFSASPGVAGRYSGNRAVIGFPFKPGPEAPKPKVKSDFTVADAQDVGASYLLRGAPFEDFTDITPFIKEVPLVKGIAADNASLLVLRAATGKSGLATFSVEGAGGSLYPMTGQVPIKALGGKTLAVPTRESGGKYYGLALYRPPSSFGQGYQSKPLDFKVKFAGGEESTIMMKLVPPPIVLVHGTYDNPKFCYEQHDDEDDTVENMAPMLRKMGYDVSAVDWEETNGNKDPSEFEHNRMTVYRNEGGIQDALVAMRKKGIVVGQADVICHSQGGAITRTYIRGYPFSVGMPPTHTHYNNPVKCKDGTVECWYHRFENNYLGDIHRLITISTTHRGSHVLNVFKGLAGYPDTTAADKLKKALVDVFLVGIDKGVSGITTGGVKNQIPDSLELQLIGPSPVPSHAIACVASDEDMRNQRPDSIGEAIKFSELGMGNYWNKFYKVWLGTSNEARDFLFVQLCKLAGENGMPNPDGELAKYRDLASKVAMNEDAKNVRMDALIYQMRRIVFQGLENDCTVGIKSSFGGLDEAFRTRIPETLHGWAPRYRAVQLRVLRLLTGDGHDFDNNGFPGYTGIKSKGSSFFVAVPAADLGSPITDSMIPFNPNFKPYLKTGTTGTATKGNTTTNRVASIEGATFSPETLALPESWKDSSGFGGSAKFVNGRLELASPNEPEAEANTFLKAPLRGDFDLVIDYRLDGWKATNDGQVQFDIMLSPSPKTVGQDYILVGRRTTSEGDLVGVAPWKELPGEDVKALTKGSGKMRISRKAAAWKVSQWDGSAWKLVHTFDSADNPEVYLGFGLSVGGEGDNAKVSVQIGKADGQ